MGTTSGAWGADALSDCPECRSAGSVARGVCQVCFAEPDEVGPGAGGALRFADVIAELDAMADLARQGAGTEVAETCRRARLLLQALKEQFLEHVVIAPAGSPPVPELQAPPEPEGAGISR